MIKIPTVPEMLSVQLFSGMFFSLARHLFELQSYSGPKGREKKMSGVAARITGREAERRPVALSYFVYPFL